MKQFIYILTLVIFLCVVVAVADFRTKHKETIKIVPKGCGYTIIEAGRAVDCSGDTILITKIHPEIAALN